MAAADAEVLLADKGGDGVILHKERAYALLHLPQYFPFMDLEKELAFFKGKESSLGLDALRVYGPSI